MYDKADSRSIMINRAARIFPGSCLIHLLFWKIIYYNSNCCVTEIFHENDKIHERKSV